MIFQEWTPMSYEIDRNVAETIRRWAKDRRISLIEKQTFYQIRIKFSFVHSEDEVRFGRELRAVIGRAKRAHFRTGMGYE